MYIRNIYDITLLDIFIKKKKNILDACIIHNITPEDTHTRCFVHFDTLKERKKNELENVNI